MSEPYWTLVQCWTNVGPTQKMLSPTVALEAKTGQKMSDSKLPSTALAKIWSIKTTLRLHGTICSVGSVLIQRLTNVLHRFTSAQGASWPNVKFRCRSNVIIIQTKNASWIVHLRYALCTLELIIAYFDLLQFICTYIVTWKTVKYCYSLLEHTQFLGELQ